MSMINLRDAIDAWGTPDFNNVIKAELEQMSVEQLPLQQGLSFSSIALDTSIQAIIISSSETKKRINVKVSLFYTGVISGCNCADDPSPIDEQSEHCELQLDIDKISGDAAIRLLAA